MSPEGTIVPGELKMFESLTQSDKIASLQFHLLKIGTLTKKTPGILQLFAATYRNWNWAKSK